MFEVKKNETNNKTSKTFRLPDDLIEKLEALANEKEVSLNQLVIQCCQYALNNLKQDSE